MVIMQIRWSNFGPLAKQLPSKVRFVDSITVDSFIYCNV